MYALRFPADPWALKVIHLSRTSTIYKPETMKPEGKCLGAVSSWISPSIQGISWLLIPVEWTVTPWESGGSKRWSMVWFLSRFFCFDLIYTFLDFYTLLYSHSSTFAHFILPLFSLFFIGSHALLRGKNLAGKVIIILIIVIFSSRTVEKRDTRIANCSFSLLQGTWLEVNCQSNVKNRIIQSICKKEVGKVSKINQRWR